MHNGFQECIHFAYVQSPALFPGSSPAHLGRSLGKWQHFSVSTVSNGYIILLFKTSIHVYVKAHIHWFYKAYLPHLASPPETI